MLKIFVLHYSKLVERKENILKQFNKYNITNYEFIELFDVEKIKNNYHLKFQKISIGSVSLLLKHIYAYKQIIDNYDEALILEDDIILCDDFMNKLNLYLTQLPKDYDMLFLGDGCDLHIPNNQLVKDIYIYKKCHYPTIWGGNGVSRCSDSYIVNKKCAIQLYEYFNLNKIINLPIDWWINESSSYNNFNVYWAEPTIITQGSRNGVFQQSYKY